MTFEQKCEALTAIGEFSIKFRESEFRRPGVEPWYVSQQIDIKEGNTLVSIHGNGNTPEDAVNDHWRQVTEVPKDKWIIIKAGTPQRRAIRWNGFMWADVREPTQTEPGATV